MKVCSILLAAGQGVRMHSKLPKVLHPILGKPMIWYALEAARKAAQTRPVVVVGHGADAVEKFVGEGAQFVLQEHRLGTGHAVQQAVTVLRDQCDLVLVTYGDMPLLRSTTLEKLIKHQLKHAGVFTMLTGIAEDPRGFGRIIRDNDGKVNAIIEEAQATPNQLDIRELNLGVYCFKASWLWDALEQIPLSSKGEYYLTDLVGIAVSQDKSVMALQIEDPVEAIGVNTRVHLAEVEKVMRRRINHDWMLAGVSIIDPDTTYIEPDVIIGQDTTLFPNTILRGKTEIGEDCEIGPNSMIVDTRIGNSCKVISSILEQTIIEDEVYIGPYGHLRKGAHLASRVHMGNFGEVKDSYLGYGTKMGHFSYIGNATIGANVNIGCGTITCNYDGKHKNPTEVGDDAFIGSDTMLVAPVKIGKGSRTGAGSVVTKDVPENTLVVGIPARIIRKMGDTNEV